MAFTLEQSERLYREELFASGQSHNCPECGAEVTGATLYEKREPDMYSLYVQPCNHRLGLWAKAPAWITNVKIIPDEEEAVWNDGVWDDYAAEHQMSLTVEKYLERRYGTSKPSNIRDYWQT